MRLAHEITAIAIRRVDDGQLPLSEICVAGAQTDRQVAGQVLEAAVEIDGRYLLFMTEGLPREDLLSIYLIDREGALLDSASIGQWVCPGLFADLALEPPNVVRFRFLGDVDWRVELHPEPRFAWPLVPEARCVKRPFGFQRRFRVRATAKS
jgi:hypothetical protein